MFKNLRENIDYLKNITHNSADFTVRNFTLTDKNRTKCVVITTEGMCNKESLAISVINPIIMADYESLISDNIYDYVYNYILSASEIVEIKTFEEVLTFSMSGFAVLGFDGSDKMLAIGVQGFSFRSVSEPESEIVQRGSREGFTEALRINMTLIRRRMKTPNLVFETLTVGEESQTQMCLCYIKGKASDSSVNELKKRLNNCNLKTLLGSGYLVPYIEDSGKNEIFTGVGITERPDTLCGKMTEGRIGVMIDGTPSTLIVPHLFIENFQSVDDYTNRPYFATFIRLLKYSAYLIAIFLPGVYLGFITFHPEYFPQALLVKIEEAIQNTPLPILLEVLLIEFIYEIMREAGLRLPKSLGHAVSIVGGLVIGDCAINAGLIGAPTLMVVAVSAIASYVIPDLYPQITVLRLSYILVGGIFGVWGIVLLSVIVVISMCSKSTLGVIYMSPLSPFSLKHMRDVFVRLGWKRLSRHTVNVQNLKGGSMYEE